MKLLGTGVYKSLGVRGLSLTPNGEKWLGHMIGICLTL